MDELLASCRSPAAHQAVVLRRLLTTHRSVAILRRHGVEVPPSWAEAPRQAPREASTVAAAAADGAAAVPAPADLLRQLPLTSYGDYQPAIERLLAAGRQYDAADPASRRRWEAAAGEVSGLPVFGIYCTSGTTGSQKQFPASMEALHSMIRVFALIQQATPLSRPQASSPRVLSFPFAREPQVLPNGVAMGPMSTVNLHRMMSMRDSNPTLKRSAATALSPPLVSVGSGDVHTCYYLHWLCALPHRLQVVKIVESFGANLLLEINLLIEHWPSLMADLGEGRCFSWLPADGEAAADGAAGAPNATGGLPVPPAATAAAVDAQLSPSPDLALELQEVFDGSMSKYVPHLRELLPTVPFLSEVYGATEGFFGFQSEVAEFHAARREAAPADAAAAGFAAFQREPDGRKSYVLMPNADCYMEFLPCDSQEPEDAGAATVSMEEVEVAKRYELVVSSIMGLYRMGDVLLCVGHLGKTPKAGPAEPWRRRRAMLPPRVVVEGRRGQVLNLVWEKMSEAELVAGVEAAAAGALPGGACALREWAAREEVHADGGDTVGHYVVYWQLAPLGTSGGGGPAPAPAPADVAAWAARLDAALRAQCPIYGLERGGRIAGVELKVVGAGVFEEVRHLAYRSGTSPVQYKPPVVVSKPEQVQALEQRVLVAAACV